MVKRELTKEEMNIYDKRIRTMQQQQEIIKGEIKRLDFNNDFLLEHNYKKMKIAIKGELGKAKEDFATLEENIKVMKTHLKEGVEVKKKEDN